MHISIWDLDWYYKTSDIPNIQCMQLSSFCKQKNYIVNFITKEEHIKLNCDYLYIFKEKEETPYPNKGILTKTTTRLIGSGFKYYNTKSLSSIIVACRPDYLLYDEPRSKYHNANFIQFFCGDKLIKNRQDFHNIKKYKKFTIVADKNLWKATKEDILWCLKQLLQEKNILFLYPISIKRIIEDEEIQNIFLELHFGTGTEFKWRNDYSSTNVQPIINFLQQLKTKTKSNLGFIPIKGTVDNLNNKENIWRCFYIVYLFKINQLQCIIIAPKNSSSIIEQLELWTKYNFRLSYVEYVLHDYVLSSGILWNEILNNSIHWRNIKIDNLLFFLTGEEWEANKYLLFSQWGDERLSDRNIDYDYIKENINLLYKE